MFDTHVYINTCIYLLVGLVCTVIISVYLKPAYLSRFRREMTQVTQVAQVVALAKSVFVRSLLTNNTLTTIKYKQPPLEAVTLSGCAATNPNTPKWRESIYGALLRIAVKVTLVAMRLDPKSIYSVRFSAFPRINSAQVVTQVNRRFVTDVFKNTCNQTCSLKTYVTQCVIPNRSIQT